MLNFKAKSFVIVGARGSGKTTLAQDILSQTPRSLVYDTLHEYADDFFTVYRPTDRASVSELETVVRHVLKPPHPFTMFVIDEANRFCPPKPKPLPQAVADLNDWGRHYELSWGFICRRPVQLNSDLTELADYIIVFGLDGKNDIAYLNELHKGFGDMAANLPKYHFLIKAGREITHYNPVSVYVPDLSLKANGAVSLPEQ